MKIGLVLPTNLYYAPYVQIYLNILAKNNIKYDLISWDRAGVGENFGIIFEYVSPFDTPKLLKILDYWKYIRFAKKKINEGKYDKLIIFGSQTGIFLYPLLKKKYKSKFLLDYRDLSIEQNLKLIFNNVLKISFLNVISSDGFKNYLPLKYKYILSHNFQINKIENALKYKVDEFKIFANRKINITTIGALRDLNENIELMEKFINDDRFYLNFVGTGIAENSLKMRAEELLMKNINFHGFYNKEDEENLVKEADFLNIYYPKIKTHSSALSNRFYMALLLKKPMIVTNNSVQGSFVEKFNLGISIENCDNLKEKIECYIANFDKSTFIENSNLLLKRFSNDYSVFVQNFNFFLDND